MPRMSDFKRAEERIAENRSMLEERYSGYYLYVESQTLAHTVGTTHDEAAKAFNKIYGPLVAGGSKLYPPYPERWFVVGLQL